MQAFWKGAAQAFNIVAPNAGRMPAADHAIKMGREQCPQHSGTDARNGSYDKNGSGALPATERVHSGSDARNGLYDKNGTGERAAFLKASCGNDARAMPATYCTIKTDRDSSTPFGALKI